MGEATTRQLLLNGKKTERIIFAVTPELKRVVADVAREERMSTSALVSSLLAKKAIERGNR